MTPERWRQVRDSLEALAGLDRGARARFLVTLKDRDAQLAADVEDYLAAAPPEGFLSAAPVPGEVPMAPRTRVGPYELLDRLGRGGMGEVWKARDTRLGREVAIKTLPSGFAADSDRMARFAREARLLASLNHPNIATVYGLEEMGQTHALVLELVEGPTLADRVREGPLPADDVIALARQIADALEAAHARGITHRDIKPANIATTADGRVKVLDFGLAKEVLRVETGAVEATTAAPARGMTAVGGVLGTPTYMSPEQVRGGQVDHRADLWAFGCVLFELLAGSPPFQASSVAETFSAILEHDPDWSRLPPETPARLRTVIQRCLEKAADERLPGAAAAREELRGPGAPGDGSRSTPPGLPVPRTSLVGRDAELAHIASLLPEARLLTLTGTGGSGKTRLAVEIGLELTSRYPGGVRFASLAGLGSPEAVAPAIAQAFGVRLPRDHDAVQALALQLGHELDSPALLILDNFEHLLEAAPVVSLLLDACPPLAVLVTSRTPLRIYGEQEFPVPPLSLPPLDMELSLAELAANPAVKLFVDRARAVQPAFTLNGQNAPDVRWICTRLDGLPLAIELAAARVKLFAPPVMRKRLTSRLALLTGGPRDSPDRQQALRKTLDWSHDLLEEEEQRLFRRLAVFAGGFTLEAAEAVANAWRDLDDRVLDGVVSLAEKSVLQQREQSDGEPRFVMLETIREYATERLEASREARTARKAHAAYFLVRAEEGPGARTAAEFEGWLDACELEHDNLRAALDWLIATRSADWAARMGGALFHFWDSRELFPEGQAYQGPLLDVGYALGRTAERASMLRNAAGLMGGDESMGYLLEALDIFRELGDRLAEAGSLNDLGVNRRVRGLDAEARSFFEQSVQVCRELGLSKQTAGALGNFAAVLHALGDLDRARSLAEEALVTFQAEGDRSSEGWALSHLADMARSSGDEQAARARYLEAVDAFEAAQDNWGLARTFTDLGHLALDRGDTSDAAWAFGRAVTLVRDVGHRQGTVRVCEAVARLTAVSGLAEETVALASFAEALRARVGRSVRETGERAVPAPSPDDLSADRRAAARERGRRMSPEAALELAGSVVLARGAGG
jgi:predicted ATPase/serine/threonine protein kinase